MGKYELSKGWVWQGTGFVRRSLQIEGRKIEAVRYADAEEDQPIPTARGGHTVDLCQRYIIPGLWDLSWEDESKLFQSCLAQQDRLSQGITTMQVLCPGEAEMFRDLIQQYPHTVETDGKGPFLHILLHAVIASLKELVDFLPSGLKTGMGRGSIGMGGVFFQLDDARGQLLWEKEELKRCAYLAHANHLQILLTCTQAKHLPMAVETIQYCKTYPAASPLVHHLIAPPVINESLLHISLHLPLALDVQGHLLSRLWRPLKNKKPGGDYALLSEWIHSPYFHLISGGDYPSGLGQWKAAEEQLLSLLMQEYRDKKQKVETKQLQRQVRTDCLQALTLRPSRHSLARGNLQPLGRGGEANLLVLQQNPLEERRLGLYPHLERVMLDGEWVQFY